MSINPENLKAGESYVAKVIEEYETTPEIPAIEKMIQKSLAEPISLLEKLVEANTDGTEYSADVAGITYQPLKHLGELIIKKKLEIASAPKQEPVVVSQPKSDSDSFKFEEIYKKIKEISSPCTFLSSFSLIAADIDIGSSQKVNKLVECVNDMNIYINSKPLPSTDLSNILRQLSANAENVAKEAGIVLPKSEQDTIELQYVDNVNVTLSLLETKYNEMAKELRETRESLRELEEMKRNLTEELRDAEDHLKKSEAANIVPGLALLVVGKKGTLEERFHNWFAAFALLNSFIVEQRKKLQQRTSLIAILVLIWAVIIYRFLQRKVKN